MNAIRTPDERFVNLPDFPYAPHYAETCAMRMHYVDEGAGDAILCLHGEPSWSFLYRKMIPPLSAGHRVVAPDLIGFGRSDKPTEREAYSFAMHHDALAGFIETLDLRRITLVCQDWGGLLGLAVAVEWPDRFERLVIMNTGLPTGEKPPSPAFMAWRDFAAKTNDMDIGRVVQMGTVSNLSEAVLDAYRAPFPGPEYKAGAHMFPLLVPISPDHPTVEPIKKTRAGLKAWTKPTLVMFSDKDPITKGADRWFRANIPAAADQPEIVIRDAGHFLQEDKGEEVAREILAFMKRTPLESADS